MAGEDTSRGGRRAHRRLKIAAGLLWIVAVALVVVWVVAHTQTGASAAVTSSTAAAASITRSTAAPSTSTTLPPTTVPPTTESTTTSTTSTTEPPSLTVAAGGDVHGDRKVGTYIDANGGAAVFAKVAPYLKTADIAFVNLEGPVSDKGSKVTFKEYTFRSRLALIDGLVSAGIDVVSLANNHAVDCGQAALLDTIERLDAAGILQAGAGKNISAARGPALIETDAGTVAVLAFTDKYSSGYAAGAERAGIAPIGDGSKVLEAIRAAGKKADYVVVSFHWGTEYTFNAASYQRSLARKCVDAGADLILGHHPHVIQGLEVYKDKLIAYSLGDFVFDHRPGPTGEAFVLRVTMRKSGPPVVRIIPVYLTDSHGIPQPVTGSKADIILNRLIKLSAGFDTELTRVGDIAWFNRGGSTEPPDDAEPADPTDPAP